MPSCVVKSCKNYKKKNNKSQGITYHKSVCHGQSKEVKRCFQIVGGKISLKLGKTRFPKNKTRKDEWVQIIRKCRDESDWNPSAWSTVCSEHFEEDDYSISAQKSRFLIPDAKPTRLLSVLPDPLQSTTHISSLPSVQISTNDKGVENCKEPSSALKAPTSQLQVPTDDLALTGYCRLCASSKSDHELLNFEADNGLKILVVNMLNRLNAQIDFSQEDLPTAICSECAKSLCTAYDFIVGIDLAQETLNKNVSTQKHKYMTPQKYKLNDNIKSNTSLQQTNNETEACDRKPLMLHAPSNSTINLQLSSNNGAETSGPLIKLEPGSVILNSQDTSSDEASSSGQLMELELSPIIFNSQFISNSGEASCGQPIKMEVEVEPSLLDPPRKRRLKCSLTDRQQQLLDLQRKNIKRLNQIVRRFRSRNESLKNKINYLKRNNIDIDIYNALNKNFVAADLFNNFNRKRRNEKITFSDATKKFCQTLNYYSPRAYDYVRQSFDTCLPHPKTLAKWTGNDKGEPEFTEEAFKALEAEAAGSKDYYTEASED